MEIVLCRKYRLNSYTIGKVYVNGLYFCDSLEDRDRLYFGEKKIYGETAIPVGRYKIEMSWSPKYQRMMPRLLNVPQFTGILIHSGNKPEHTAGCILTGLNKEKGKVLYSKYYADTIRDKIMDAEDRGEEIWITIK